MPRSLSRRRKWLYRALAVCLPLAGLFVLEIGLNWGGFGKDLRLVQATGDHSHPGMFRLNPDADLAYYGATNLRGPEPRPFRLPKPHGTFRIVVVGASTVNGFPYSSELAFPRLMEIALTQQGLDRDFEVLNAGITAISSISEVDVFEQAIAACQPDLIVLYTGHNEFVGPDSVGSKSGGISPRLSRVLYPWRRTRLHQVCVSGLRRQTVDRRPLLEQLPGDLKIPIHSAKFRRAEGQLRENLQRMVEIAAAAKVPLLLTTPIVNLRHQSPLASLSRDGMTAVELNAWRQALSHGEELLAKGQPERALESLERAQAIDDGHALAAYRRGQSLEGLGRWSEAQAAFQSACDLDGCRLRAPSSFTRIIEEVAAGAPTSNVHFLDTASAFARDTPNGIPGNESFLEHVHFTYSGNWRLALILAEKITLGILGETWRAERVPDQAQRVDLCGVIVQDHFVADGLVLVMLERPPMSQGADVALQITDLRSDAQRLFADLPPREGRVLGGLSLSELQLDLIGTLASGYDRAGLEDEMRVILGRGIRRQPWRLDFREQLNRALAGKN